MNRLMERFGQSDRETTIVNPPKDYVSGSGWVDSDEEVKVLAEISDEERKVLEAITKSYPRNMDTTQEDVGKNITQIGIDLSDVKYQK